MPYSLDFAPPVRDYLRSHVGLSRQGRIILYASLNQDLRVHGDTFRRDPSRRLEGDSSRFVYDIAFRDQDGDGKIHHFWFIVSDRSAEYGVLRLEFVEET